MVKTDVDMGTDKGGLESVAVGYAPLEKSDTGAGSTGSRGATYLEAKDAELNEDLTGQQYINLQTLGGSFWGTESDLDENAYGAAAVAMIRDVTKLIQQCREGAPREALALTIVRLMSCFGIMIVNLVFQMLILWYIYVFVVQPSVRNVQTLYSDFHAKAFDETGNFLEEVWIEYDRKTEVCQITMSSREFYFGILALWGLLMMMELRSVQRVCNNIMAVKHVDTVTKMLDYVSTENYELGGRCLVVGLTEPMRYSVLFFVCLPRLLIAFMLFFLGCQWLSASASFSDMTLNAMALQFVKDIDEILYQALLPKSLTRMIADTNVFIVEKRKTKKDMDNDEWKGYKRTLGWILFMIAFLGGFGFAWQTVLPFDLTELTMLCQEQVEMSQTPLCTESTWNGQSQECYPYGVVDEDLAWGGGDDDSHHSKVADTSVGYEDHSAHAHVHA